MADDEEHDELDAEVDAAMAACGGNARAAIKALLIMQSYYEAEIERLAEAVSAGFARGRVRTSAPARDVS